MACARVPLAGESHEESLALTSLSKRRVTPRRTESREMMSEGGGGGWARPVGDDNTGACSGMGGKLLD